jgi:hypothetical protein
MAVAVTARAVAEEGSEETAAKDAIIVAAEAVVRAAMAARALTFQDAAEAVAAVVAGF